MTELNDRLFGVKRTFHLVSVERLNESSPVGRISCFKPIALERRICGLLCVEAQKDAESSPPVPWLFGKRAWRDL